MEDYVEKFRQADALAQNILRLTRNTLLVNLRFLDLALSQFQLTSYPGTLATDGQHLFYDTYYVLSMYKRERGRNVRDYLHIVLHCVFRHLFTSANIDRRCWDLACDIAVESAIEDLHLESAACNRAYAQEDPVVAYKREGYEMFEAMIQAIREETVRRIFLARIQTNEELKREKVAKETGTSAPDKSQVKRAPVRKEHKVGPNDPCPCGSGKKYKKCCMQKDKLES